MRRFLILTIACAMLGSAGAPCVVRAAWAPTGNPLCNISGYQHPPGAARGWFPTGPVGPSLLGMFVVWQDLRSGEGDLYGGIVTEMPPPDPAPGQDGAPFVVAAGNQWSPVATRVAPIPSGAQWQGPAFVVAWAHGDPLHEIRAKRIFDPADWGATGVPVAPDDPTPGMFPAITDDGDSCAIVAWMRVTPAQRLIRAQRLNAIGERMWGDAGVPVGLDTTVQGEPRIARAPGGGAYILRSDHRVAGTLAGQRALVLYRLGADGATAPGWTADGVVLETQAPGWYQVLADGSGGVFVAWTEQEPLSDQTTGIETRVTRIQPDGTPAAGWTLAGSGAVARDDGHRLLEDIDLDGTGGVVLVIGYDQVVGGASPTGRDLVVQRLLADGTRPAGWPAAGHTLCGEVGMQDEARLIGQGGGLLAVWRDQRSGAADLHALRLDPDGTPGSGWDPAGLLVCGAPGTQSGVRIAHGNHGGAVFVWQDWRDPATGPDLYMQIVNANGELDVPRPLSPTLTLTAPRPSPAHGSVELELGAPGDGTATVEALDVSGRVVRRFRVPLVAGRNTIRWEVEREDGRRVAPGVYHLRVATPWGERSRKVVVLG